MALMTLCRGALGDPLGRREQSWRWSAAAIVDAAVSGAIIGIPAQSIRFRLPRSGNVGPEEVRPDGARRRRSQRDGARINGPMMQSKMTADWRVVPGFSSEGRRLQSRNHKQKAASQCALCADTSWKSHFILHFEVAGDGFAERRLG